MAVDFLAASRRPLQKLLQDCSVSRWENIALFLDDGATEAVRWAGGLGFVLEELGISRMLDLEAFAPGRSPPNVPESEGLTRGIFVVTNFLWDVEGAVLRAARTYGLTEVTLACSISEEGHACHPHAAHISEETGGRVSFPALSQQLKVSLERMLKIKAQSSNSSRLRFSSASPSSPPSSSSSSIPVATEASPYVPVTAVTPSVHVKIVHSPLHIGCFFQPPTTRISGGGSNGVNQITDSEQRRQQQHQGCSAFSLASPACARVFPLRQCDWKGGGGGGAGAALFAVAAAAEGGGGGNGDAEGHVSAEEVPREERLRYRLLAHTLVEALWDQLQLDVSGGGGVFALGDTSRLIGTTVAAVADDVKRVALERPAPPGFGLGGTGSSGTARREASVVLVDRTLDLAAAASHGGSLLQRILDSIPRTGTPKGVTSSFSSSSNSASEAAAADWSPASGAHQQDVGVVLPMLTPGLGLPAHAAELAGSAGDNRGGGSAQEKPPRLLAMKALSGFSWPAPPSLCHSGGSGDAAAAAGVVHAMACHREEEGQAALISALEKCVSDNGCIPPPRKRRGMGASIMALATSLAKGNPHPRGRGLSGDQVCYRCRGVLQVALAAMEAHQRTSSLAGSGWPETVAAERMQLQQLRDGGAVDVIMEQLCATLNQRPPAGSSSSSSSSPPLSSGGGTGPIVGEGRTCSSARDALLLALRGVSLAGESIGAKEASDFRKAWISRMIAGGFREAGSGVPPGVAEAVERISPIKLETTTSKVLEPAGALVGGVEPEEAGVLLELEDIARERTQRLREAAASRAFQLKNTAVLRDLAFEPYTFVASATATAAVLGTESSGGGSSGDSGREEGWDDWGEDETAEGAPDDVDGDGGGPPTEHSTECDTLVGRLAGLLLDRTSPHVPDLHEAKLVSAASVGLGFLSSGLKKLGRIGGAAGGSRRGGQNKSRPADRPVVVIFVVGGFTPLELAEVSGVVRCAAAAAATAGGGGLDTEVILAGTTVSTPDVTYEQIFSRPPAGQG